MLTKDRYKSLLKPDMKNLSFWPMVLTLTEVSLTGTVPHEV